MKPKKKRKAKQNQKPNLSNCGIMVLAFGLLFFVIHPVSATVIQWNMSYIPADGNLAGNVFVSINLANGSYLNSTPGSPHDIFSDGSLAYSPNVSIGVAWNRFGSANYSYNFSGINQLSNSNFPRVDFINDQFVTSQISVPNLHTGGASGDNVWLVKTNTGNYAIVSPVVNYSLLSGFPPIVATYFNLTVKYQTDGSLNFGATTGKNLAGTYTYNNISMGGLDVVNGTHWIYYDTGASASWSGKVNLSDYYTYYKVGQGNGFVARSVRPGTSIATSGSPYATVDCFTIPPSNFTAAPTADIAICGTSLSCESYCLNTAQGMYKLGLTITGTYDVDAQSSCALPSASTGKIEINSSQIVSFNFAQHLANNTPTYLASGYDFAYSTNNNRIDAYPTVPMNIANRQGVTGFDQSHRTSDINDLALIDCKLISLTQPGTAFNNIDPVTPGVDKPYAQDTYCFNLTANYCGNPTYAAIKVLRTGYYCVTGFCPLGLGQVPVFDFYWMIYPERNFFFSQTAFVPDPKTASSTLDLLWNTSNSTTTKLIWNVYTGSTTSGNFSTEKIENVQFNHNVTIDIVQNAYYQYWLQANLSGTIYESDMRNFSTGNVITIPGGDDLVDTGVVENNAQGVYLLGFLILLVTSGLGFIGGGFKLGVSIFLAGLTIFSLVGLLPQFLVIPLLVLTALVVVRLFRGGIHGSGGQG